MTRLHGAPLQHSYWVDDTLIAGEHPGGPDRGLARDRIARLLDAGVRCIVDLTEPYELEPYERLLRDEALVRNIHVRYTRLSIRNRRVPPPQQMRSILDAITWEGDAGRRTYVHGWGGMDRVGTVVGCYLVRCGHTGEEALAETARLVASMGASPGRTSTSPETSAQRLFVLSWKDDVRRHPSRTRRSMPIADLRLIAS